MKRNAIAAIVEFNKGRDPKRLEMKYEAMTESPFVFLRATCHLFHADLAPDGQLVRSPASAICGDLHFENFGAYRGDNRVSYFDINDFDEAVHAPCWWDVARFLTSLLVAARTFRLARPDASHLCNTFLGVYGRELASGKGRWLERDVARGMVGDLLSGLARRTRGALLAKRTEPGKKGRGRRLKVDGQFALPVPDSDRAKVTLALANFASQQSDPRFFRVLDVARRVAGTGSLGLERYVILVEGRGTPDGHFLLDLKHQPGSALAPHVPSPQPAWPNEAVRVVTLQRRMQAISPAFLNVLEIADRSYVLKELMPRQDRLELDQWNGKLQQLERVAEAMGALAAWAHLRSAGWRHTEHPEELVAFGDEKGWQAPVLEWARHYADTVKQDWKDFCTAYREKRLEEAATEAASDAESRKSGPPAKAGESGNQSSPDALTRKRTPKH